MKLKMLTLTNTEVLNYEGLAHAILDMNGRLDNTSRLWFVAWDGKTWLGFTGFRKIDTEKVYFGPTFVKEEFRGMGLQRRMIRVKLKKAKEDGYKVAISSVLTYNYWSANNLIKEGFLFTPIPNYYEAEGEEIWFKKEL